MKSIIRKLFGRKTPVQSAPAWIHTGKPDYTGIKLPHRRYGKFVKPKNRYKW
jgi:hypothetical protein